MTVSALSAGRFSLLSLSRSRFDFDVVAVSILLPFWLRHRVGTVVVSVSLSPRFRRRFGPVGVSIDRRVGLVVI